MAKLVLTWEVGKVRQRRLLQGIGVAVLGLALACAPVAVASASHHKAKSHNHHHSSKPKTKTKTKTNTASKGGSDPNNTICLDIKNSEASSESLEPAIEKAILGGATGNFATLKQALLTELNAPLKDEGEALSALRSAPANVQAAMKGLISFDNSFKTAISNATSLTQLEESFQTLGSSAAALQGDATTLENYVTSLCGTITTTT